MSLQRLHQDRRDRDRGAAAVEFALVLLPLVLVVFGIIEFGRAYNAQVTLQHAVREGARYYALHHDEDTAVEDTKDVTVAAATSIDLDKDRVTVSPDPCDPPDPGTVAAEYDFAFITWQFGDDPEITLSAEGVMRCGG